MIIKLNFEDPSKISPSNDPDILLVQVQEEIEVKKDEWMALLKIQSAKKAIPP